MRMLIDIVGVVVIERARVIGARAVGSLQCVLALLNEFIPPVSSLWKRNLERGGCSSPLSPPLEPPLRNMPTSNSSGVLALFSPRNKLLCWFGAYSYVFTAQTTGLWKTACDSFRGVEIQCQWHQLSGAKSELGTAGLVIGNLLLKYELHGKHEGLSFWHYFAP